MKFYFYAYKKIFIKAFQACTYVKEENPDEWGKEHSYFLLALLNIIHNEFKKPRTSFHLGTEVYNILLKWVLTLTEKQPFN